MLCFKCAETVELLEFIGLLSSPAYFETSLQLQAYFFFLRRVLQPLSLVVNM